jgi:beta-glucanase (GH16 family)
MDNLQVWNRALSATEAFNLWQSQQVGAYPLVDNLWYPANNTTASTIPGCFEAANASVTGGTLVITTLYQTETCISSASGTGTLSSALKNYTAEDLYNPQPFLYGTFEIKIQLAGPAALNSTSFWLLSTACLPNPFQNVFARPICVTRTTTNYRELDIVENGFQGLGEVGQNIYTDTIDQTFNTAVSTGTSAPHIYDVVWTPTGVVFEIDGVVTAQYPTTTLTIPMFMILDSGPGSGAVPANYPQTATIYYVKHWNLAGQLDFNYVPF